MIALLLALAMVVLLGWAVPFEGTGDEVKPESDSGERDGLLLTVAQVCRRIPGARSNKRVCPSTISRWITTGVPARNGQRVKLRAKRVGSRWLIDPVDLETFCVALASTDPVPQSPPKQQSSPRTETQQRNASERAARELERRGA